MDNTEIEEIGHIAAQAYIRSNNRENALALMLHDSDNKITVEQGRILWEAIDHYVDVSE